MEMLDRDQLAPMGAEGCAKGGADAFAEGSGQAKKRGRPRKKAVPGEAEVSEGMKDSDKMSGSENAAGSAGVPGEATPKKSGRPRIHPAKEPGAEPRKRGRPAIHPVMEDDICGAAFRKQGRKPKNGWKAEELLEGEAINGAWEKVAELLLRGEPGMPIREIAKEANISRDMVYRYLKDEGFNRYLDALIDEEIRSCEAAIWHRLKEMCLEGDLQAIKYYFDLRGKRAKGPEEGQGTVVQIIDDVPDLSPEELKEIYGPLAGEELTDDA